MRYMKETDPHHLRSFDWKQVDRRVARQGTWELVPDKLATFSISSPSLSL